jgi:hypothetical protein
MKNQVFSRILTPGGLLDEAASWEYFADYLKNKTIAVARFNAAYESLVASDPQGPAGMAAN